jgi:hypothetical protein
MITSAIGLPVAHPVQNGVFMSTTSPDLSVDTKQTLIEVEQDERAIFEKVCRDGDTRGVEFDPVHNRYVGADHKIQWNIDKAKHINAAWYGWLMSIANRQDKAKIKQLQKQVAELTHEKAVLQEQLPDQPRTDNPAHTDHAKALLLNPSKEPAIAGYGAFWKERGHDCSQLAGGHPGELAFGISYIRSLGFECQEHALIRLADYRIDMSALRAHVTKVEGVLLDVYNQNELSLGDDERILAVLDHKIKT